MKYSLVMITCFLLPIIGGLWFIRKKQNIWISFLIGMAAFVISQIIIRIPLLQVMQNQMSIQFYFIKHPLTMMLFLAFTAGLFEECARWIGFSCIKKKHDSLYDAIAFGFGHGGIEAMLLIAPTLLLNQVPMDNVWLACFERIVAIAFHVALALFVWYGVHKRKVRWLCFAILLHAGLDCASLVSSNIYVVELYIFVYTAIVWFICYTLVVKKVRMIPKRIEHDVFD